MYTAEERDTFRFCISRWTPDEPVLRALAAAMKRSCNPQGVTEVEVCRELPHNRFIGRMAAVSRVLGELARDTREHGVPIAVMLDADGLLRYWLSREQISLVLRQEARSPAYVG